AGGEALLLVDVRRKKVSEHVPGAGDVRRPRRPQPSAPEPREPRGEPGHRGHVNEDGAPCGRAVSVCVRRAHGIHATAGSIMTRRSGRAVATTPPHIRSRSRTARGEWVSARDVVTTRGRGGVCERGVPPAARGRSRSGEGTRRTSAGVVRAKPGLP